MAIEVEPKKQRRRSGTPAKALARRMALCLKLKDYLEGSVVYKATDVQIDAEAKALYWVGDWEEGFAANRTKIEKAIHIHLLTKPWSGRPRHRVIGNVVDGVFSAIRVNRALQWHPRLDGWTFNKHLLLHHKDFGFDRVEINGRHYAPAQMLDTYPDVPVSESGGYELNILLKVSATATA